MFYLCLLNNRFEEEFVNELVSITHDLTVTSFSWKGTESKAVFKHFVIDGNLIISFQFLLAEK